VVTGATGGIGAGIAARFDAAGAVVVAHGRSSKPTLFGPSGLSVQLDLALDDAAESLASVAMNHTGRIDAWINNAALQPVGEFLSLTPDDERAVVDSNLGFVMRGTRAAAAHVGSAGLAVVNIASIEGLVPAAGHSHYSAAKAAVIQHTRASALELGRLGVRVNAVAPGLIDRPGLADDWPDGVRRWEAAAPLGRLGTADDVANACLFLCSPAAAWISGTTLVVDGGMLTRSPW
jgi:3-oxoacyl-[acyl-carrier protein] reductase